MFNMNKLNWSSGDNNNAKLPSPTLRRLQQYPSASHPEMVSLNQSLGPTSRLSKIIFAILTTSGKMKFGNTFFSIMIKENEKKVYWSSKI